MRRRFENSWRGRGGGDAQFAGRLQRMTVRRLLLFAVLAALVACDEKHSPTAPGQGFPPADTSGQLYGTVFIQGSDGRCLTGATVEVLNGAAIGKKAPQGAEQCVSQGSLHYGYRLTGLPLGEQVMIRASAPGYWEAVRTPQPRAGGTDADNLAFNFELSKAPEASRGFIYGSVWSSEGCLTGARIELLDSSAAGRLYVQSAMDCSNNDGSGNSYFFTDLPPGTPIRIRASLPGYQSQERSVEARPDTGTAYNNPVDFTLTKSP